MLKKLMQSILFINAIVLVSCTNLTNVENKGVGGIQLKLSHNIRVDTFLYVNEASNLYMVSEIQYFISDVKLYNRNGDTIILDKNEDIHYVDTDIPESFIYDILDSIPIGIYDKMSFTFGINEAKNESMRFVNPPKSFMFWPQVLGGGYHYMKLNGKWIDNNEQQKVFNYHLGIGQLYDENREVREFVQNYQEVYFDKAFTIKNEECVEIEILMDVNNWFSGPNLIDFNEIGGKIMQNQKVMRMGCENVQNVFSIKTINSIDKNI